VISVGDEVCAVPPNIGIEMFGHQGGRALRMSSAGELLKAAGFDEIRN